MRDDHATDLELIIDKVRRAGALAQHLKANGLITRYKADGSIVTNADTEVNLWLKEALLAARPAPSACSGSACCVAHGSSGSSS